MDYKTLATKPRHMNTTYVLVDNVYKLYNPFNVILDKKIPLLKTVMRAKVQPEWDRSRWGTSTQLRRDYGRIKKFILDFQSGNPIDPIILDNNFNYGHFAGLVVCDGHHRLCAAILLGVQKIACEYSGFIDLLDWLRGIGPLPDYAL